MKERIKRLRKTLNLTQQEFAERIGVKRNTVGQYEIGRNDPTDTVITLICKEYGVNEAWLRHGTGEMFAPDPEDELSALAAKYHYSPAAGLLIEKFVNLPEDRREVIIKFLEDYAAALSELKAAKSSGASGEREKSIDEKVEEYRRKLEEEKEAAERSEVS